MLKYTSAKMSKETSPENLSEYIPPGAIEITADRATHYIGRRLAEKIIARTTVERPASFNMLFSLAISTGYLPIIVANHASHADGMAVSKVTRHLTRIAQASSPDGNFKGFSMPLAKSLLTGHQGWFLRMMYHLAEKPMKRNGLFALPLVREKDIDMYKMEDNTREYLASFRRRVEGNYGGIMLFPEGTTEGGKKDEEGNFKGMQPFEEKSISAHMKLLKKHSGRRVVIIPAGITGGSEIINSETKGIPLYSFLKILDLSMLRITLGEIIPDDGSEFSHLRTSDDINRFVGGRIARLLPSEMRGVYA